MIEIFLNNTWLNITKNVFSNFEIHERCDEVYALGSMKAKLNIKYNIPPYTILRIDGNEYFLCHSQCTKYLTYEDLYIHDIEIIEATSILSCYILGSKSFSVTGTNKEDKDKINIIAELMNQKYNTTFVFDASKLTKEQEFQFGPGTTMYDALLAIAKTYNCVPKVKKIEYNNNYENTLVEFYFYELDNKSIYPLKDNRILNVLYHQNLNDYCETLEAEMSNVIDRDTLVEFKDLTLRSDDIRMTADNAKLVLPVRIESIEKFYVKFTTTYVHSEVSIAYLDYTNSTIKSLIENIPGIEHPFSYLYITTYQNWRDAFVVDGNYPLDDIYNNHFSKIIPNKNYFYSQYFSYEAPDYNDNNPFFKLVSYDPDSDISRFEAPPELRFDITKSILPKDKYDILEPRDMPKYSYYESGSNYIDGMNEYYKADFWNTILGQSVEPFLHYAIEDYTPTFTYNFEKEKFRTSVFTSLIILSSKKAIDEKFDVIAKTIIDPMVSCKKTKKPINQNFYTKSSRSYNKGANFIDFDKMINSLQKSNDMLGLPELSIEYDSTNIETPKPAQKIIYDGNEWYVSSIIKNYNLTNYRCTMNLVSSYNKVAEVIGVPTQYNETKNPLNNIMDRPILLEGVIKESISNDVWLRINFIGDNYNSILYKRATIMKYQDTTYLYAETIDHYCFDKSTTHYNNDVFSCNDIGYVDSHNEFLECKVEIVYLPTINLEKSRKLPLYIGKHQLITSFPFFKAYKDARERILFTIKLENDII